MKHKSEEDEKEDSKKDKLNIPDNSSEDSLASSFKKETLKSEDTATALERAEARKMEKQ